MPKFGDIRYESTQMATDVHIEWPLVDAFSTWAQHRRPPHSWLPNTGICLPAMNQRMLGAGYQPAGNQQCDGHMRSSKWKIDKLSHQRMHEVVGFVYPSNEAFF